MHAWAEIEHKLAYKSEMQIPKGFRRKLSRISAKLEESDEQFEEIRNQMDSNKAILIDEAKESNTFNSKIEFNLDNLQTFLDYAFPSRNKSIEETRNLFNEMINVKINLEDLAKGFENVKNDLNSIEKEESIYYDNIELNDDNPFWEQIGAARTILELTNDSYFNYRLKNTPNWIDITKKWRNKYQTA